MPAAWASSWCRTRIRTDRHRASACCAKCRPTCERACPVTADLWVAGPEWIAVRVEADVIAAHIGRRPTRSAGAWARAIERFLHPLTGGPEGQGWEFGRKPHRSDLFALVMAVDGVDTVRRTCGVPRTRDRRTRTASWPCSACSPDRSTERSDQTEFERDLQRWLDRALVYSGRHEIRVAP